MRQLAGTKTRYRRAHSAPLAGLISGRVEYNEPTACRRYRYDSQVKPRCDWLSVRPRNRCPTTRHATHDTQIHSTTTDLPLSRSANHTPIRHTGQSTTPTRCRDPQHQRLSKRWCPADQSVRVIVNAGGEVDPSRAGTFSHRVIQKCSSGFRFRF